MSPQESRSAVIERFNEESRRFSTYDSAIAGLERALTDLGYDGFLYSVWKPSKDWLVLSDEAVMTLRGPVHLKAYEALYVWKGFMKDDPVVDEVLERSMPFTSKEVYDGMSLNARQRKLVALSHRFGLVHDLIIPMHTPRKQQVLVCYKLGKSPQVAEAIDSVRDTTIALAYMFALVISDFVNLDMVKIPNVSLSIREHESLTLMARGMSNNEIATTLNITERTAKFHVANVIRKLNAKTRSQAVAMAAKANMLTN